MIAVICCDLRTAVIRGFQANLCDTDLQQDFSHATFSHQTDHVLFYAKKTCNQSHNSVHTHSDRLSGFVYVVFRLVLDRCKYWLLVL